MESGSPLDLELAELRSFVVLAEQLHFGRAAEVLHVSQPALTKRIQRLEEKIGGSLVVRGYRDVRLTEPGRILLHRARVLLRDAALAREESRQAVRGEVGVLRVGFGVASVTQLLPDVLLRFRRSYPRVQIQIRDMSSPAQREALRRGEIDVGFIRLPVPDADLASSPLLRERLVAALGPRSPWRAKEGLGSLAEAPFVVCSRSVSASYYDHLVALCRAAGFTPRIVQEANELFSLLQLVRAGMGAALVPSAAASMRVPGVRLRDLRRADAAWDIGLAWRRQSEGAALVERFIQLARETAGSAGTQPRQ